MNEDEGAQAIAPLFRLSGLHIPNRDAVISTLASRVWDTRCAKLLFVMRGLALGSHNLFGFPKETEPRAPPPIPPEDQLESR